MSVSDRLKAMREENAAVNLSAAENNIDNSEISRKFTNLFFIASPIHLGFYAS